MWRALVRTVTLASLAAVAWAHGFMSVPVSRNIGSGTYCDQCLNGGGVGAVYASSSWPNGKHGVCGDPLSGEGAGYHEGGGKFEQTVGIRVTYYNAGDTMTVKGQLTANHLGYMQYFLCVLPPTSSGGSSERQFLTNECFRKNPLQVFQEGSWGERYYVGSGLSNFEHSVRLPDIECPRCVVRWYYLTGNSCTPPGTPAKWAAQSLVPCGGGGANPEEFWNCADVSLLKKGEPLPPPSKLKYRGEVGSGAAVDDQQGNPNDPVIENTDDGQLIGDTNDDDAGGGNGNDTDLIGFDNVVISVMVGSGLGLPIVFLNPTLGATMGLCAFIAAMVFFMVHNQTKK